MDIYKRKSIWKAVLAIAGMIIILISIFYTQYLVQRISEEEKKRVQLYIQAQEEFRSNNCEDYGLYRTIITSNTNIPLILVTPTGQIEGGVNFGEKKDMDTTYLRKEINKIIDAGTPPLINSAGAQLYYKKSMILRMLQFFPPIQLGLISFFILFGYLALSASRKAEQNRVWVGMAKETAHQLGTPITAIIGWMEHLKSTHGEEEEIQEISTEIDKDLNRLQLIAERFSKIGSEPDLKVENINSIVRRNMEYMQKRAPRKITFTTQTLDQPAWVDINTNLFDWVMENLLRNALDSMGREGNIEAQLKTQNQQVILDLKDSGKGIPSSKFKTIFNPGYSTKKRGWGLGLSLTKRIVEDYHKGKIFVKESKENQGTTFRIILPLHQKDGARV